jgi:hypothetical protein
LALALGLSLLSLAPSDAFAQLDPERRRVFQAGYAWPMKENGPIAAYGYYYHNQPDFPRTNLILRLAVAPVYLDSELGIRHVFGPQTDLSVGISGGGFADSYAEIRQGNYFEGESFTGHTGEGSVALHHLFTPGRTVPVYGVVRGAVHGAFYQRDEDTDRAFEVPESRGTGHTRVGLRVGGREPYLSPKLAAELSAWYEGQFRFSEQDYGFNGDRRIESQSHLFWARALLAYTFEKTGQYMETSLTLGTSLSPDRFSAYRLGSSLPLVAQFPLTLPGYHIQEISADQFALLTGSYLQPLGPQSRWAVGVFGSGAAVDYLAGLAQPGNWHAGVGGGLFFRSKSHAWEMGVAYSYGVEAIRGDGRGAHTVTFLLQYDVDAEQRAGARPFWSPVVNSSIWRGLVRVFGGS